MEQLPTFWMEPATQKPTEDPAHGVTDQYTNMFSCNANYSVYLTQKTNISLPTENNSVDSLVQEKH